MLVVGVLFCSAEAFAVCFCENKKPQKNSFLCFLLAFWRFCFVLPFFCFGDMVSTFGDMGATSLSVIARRSAERVVAQLDGDEGKSCQASDGSKSKS